MNKHLLPNKAFILCAGKGERLMPITYSIPKPLLPFWSESIIDRTIKTLRSWGVTEILINISYMADKIFCHVKEKFKTSGIKFSFSFEPYPLGTGGALKHAQWFINDSPFWLVNSDIIMDISPSCFSQNSHSDALAVVWVTQSAGPRTVTIENGKIASFSKGNPTMKNAFTLCGLHLIKPDIQNYFDNLSCFSIVHTYEKAIRNEKTINAVNPPNVFWADLGTPRNYLDEHFRFLEWNLRRYPSIKHKRNLCPIDPSAVIMQGAVIEHSIVMGNAQIGPNGVLKNAIVLPTVRINKPTQGINMAAHHISPILEKAFCDKIKWEKESYFLNALPPRGSDRFFLRAKNSKKKTSYIVMIYGKERKENELFTNHSEFLNSIGIPVPRVIWHNNQIRTLIMEDAGENTLLDIVNSKGITTCTDLYKKIIAITAKLHKAATPEAKKQKIKLMEQFSPALYKWEHNLFIENILRKIKPFPRKIFKNAAPDFQKIINDLIITPYVLLHRDLQSSNILINGDSITLIDFQGMRMGPAFYDVASLLFDPYVNMPPEMRNKLLNDYCRLSNYNFDTILPLFYKAAVQRLLQAAGAFGRLGALPQTQHYKKHILPCLRTLFSIILYLNQLPNMTKLIEFTLNKWEQKNVLV